MNYMFDGAKSVILAGVISRIYTQCEFVQCFGTIVTLLYYITYKPDR